MAVHRGALRRSDWQSRQNWEFIAWGQSGAQCEGSLGLPGRNRGSEMGGPLGAPWGADKGVLYEPRPKRAV